MTFPSFTSFFHALWGADRDPFPWQTMLAERVAGDPWPDAIDLPTASGKTASIDIAIYALAAQAEMPPAERSAPRRIWFVVDRRIVVDEAYKRATEIAGKLEEADSGPLKQISDRLRVLGGLKKPLAVGRLRGGVLRDDGWARLPSQPAVLTSTVDQLGSRLLFRGYGYGDNLAPMHAGLAGNDSLIVLDEAHCSVPFLQTLRAVRRFRGAGWTTEPVPAPFAFTVMSATLGNDNSAEETIETFPDADEREAALNHPLLLQRRRAAKIAELALAKAPGKAKKGAPGIGKPLSDDPLVLAAAQHAIEYTHDRNRHRVAIMVNRVATATALAAQLDKDCGEDVDVVLLTGRMRPYDRDRLVSHWEKYLGASAPETPPKPIVLVTTQCLEVGADYSFDALITECASLDALRQRFGRLDRLGALGETSARILIRPQDAKGKTTDPIYGHAMAATWTWLLALNEGQAVDFGIDAMDRAVAETHAPLENLFARSEDAPVLLPAHIDALAQTAPTPDSQPDVDLFLHGKSRRSAEVEVAWRADPIPPAGSPESYAETWIETIALTPPTSAETLRVPLHRLRSWLAAPDAAAADDGDVEGSLEPEDREWKPSAARHPFLLWRGRERSVVTRTLNEIRPGDRMILPETFGMGHLGHTARETDSGLGSLGLDIAERAGREIRRKLFLRLTPSLFQAWSDHPRLRIFFNWLAESEGAFDVGELEEAIDDLLQPLEIGKFDEDENTPRILPEWLKSFLAEWRDADPHRFLQHPDGRGLILLHATGRKADDQAAEDDLFADEDDTASAANGNGSLALDRHTRDVLYAVRRFARLCLPPDLASDLVTAARVHDLGKLDPRFQLYLHNGNESAAASDPPLAKSPSVSQSPAQRERLRRQLGLPRKFRHEAVSVQLLHHLQFEGLPLANNALVTHLVASHHGHARPFHPVVVDDTPPSIDLNQVGIRFHWKASVRAQATPLHHLASSQPDTYWNLTRRFGWWGLAYLESIFRFADWFASAHPECGGDGESPFGGIVPDERPRGEGETKATGSEHTFTGLDGANPLGFLAALGALHVLTHALPDRRIRMNWTLAQGGWRPSLHMEPAMTSEGIVEALHTHSLCTDRMFSCRLLEEAPEKGPKNKKGEASWKDKLVFPVECYRDYLANAAASSSLRAPLPAAWAAVWAGETFSRETGKIRVAARTRFDFTAGQQAFIAMVRDLRDQTGPDDIRAALFGPWLYSTTAISMRWDPIDEKRQYALQAIDPTNASANPSVADPGANRLAIEGLALYPTIPDRHASQPGFSGSGDNRRFHWHLWEAHLTLDAIRSVVALPTGISAEEKTHCGIAQTFQSSIVMPSGRYRCFTPARAI